MVPSMSFSTPRALTGLLLAGAAALCLIGGATAQSTNQQQPSSGSGLLLPGAVQPSPQQAGPAAGTIGGPAAGTIGQAPQQAPSGQGPAPGTVGAAAQGIAGGPKPAAVSPPKPAKPATPKGDWQVAPQVFTDGTFKLCGAAVEYDNNLHLILLRNPADKMQMVLGIPGAQMPTGQQAKIKVSVDAKVTRELAAIVTQPNALAINLGDDAELLKAMTTGSVLTIEVPGDVAAFQLKGTTKAVNDLTTCVKGGRDGTLKLPEPTEPSIAPSLAKLLVDAGLSSARAIPVDKIPPQQRPGDYAWQIGENVLGSVRSFPMGDAAGDFTKVSETYLEQLKKSCTGTYTPSIGAVEKLPAYQMRSGFVSCDAGANKVHVAIVMQLVDIPKQQGQDQNIRVLNVFSHEATEAEKAQADNASAGIVKVLKEKGKEPLTAPQAAAPAKGK